MTFHLFNVLFGEVPSIHGTFNIADIWTILTTLLKYEGRKLYVDWLIHVSAWILFYSYVSAYSAEG
jgi:hypothetical protein